MVDHARSTWRVSIRRACRALPVERSTYHYRSRRAGQAQLTERIKEIAATRVRYGYRRIHVLLRRDGWRVNAKRVYRLYREVGLQLRHKTPKRRVKAKLREDRRPATRSNETWAMDFVHDQLATGRKIRVLTVVDTFSRFSPVIDPRFSYRAEDVVQTLEEAVSIVQEVNRPSIQTMFDTHNAVDETEPHPVLVERYFDFIRHVHVNEMDGRYAGTGNYDFGALLGTLLRLGYQHWVSLEVFDFKPSAPQIAQASLAHLQSVTPQN